MADKVDISGEVPGPATKVFGEREPHQFGLPARDMIVAMLALVFSILFIVCSRNTGNGFWVYWAPYFLAAGALVLGIPVYASQRRHLTPPMSPPPYR